MHADIRLQLELVTTQEKCTTYVCMQLDRLYPSLVLILSFCVVKTDLHQFIIMTLSIYSTHLPLQNKHTNAKSK